MGRPEVVVAVTIAVVVGCHSPKGQPAPPDAGTPAPVASSPPTITAARFSRPIAAVRSLSGTTLVAGLAVARGAIAVTALGSDGATRWTRDVIPGVTWSANATLNVLRSRTGAVVVWRGLRVGQDVTVAAAVDADGKVDGEPFPVGAAACTTEGDLAWIDRGPKSTWLLRTQAFGSPAPVTALTLPEDRDPALLCGAHRAFALADGEDDVTVSIPGLAARPTPIRVMQEADFRGDDERGHEVYSVGDVLGIVRVGIGGSVATREVVQDHPTPWRRFGRRLTEGDDITLVDADARSALLAFTRDASAATGDGSGAISVEAVVWERGGTRDAAYQIAAPDASRVRGPFWSGAVTGGVVVGWAERSARLEATAPPIVGLAYRVVSIDGLGELRHVDRAADELVDASCDDARCYAVALARAPGEDGGQPEVAEVITYP